MSEKISFRDDENIKKLFVGKSIVHVEDDVMTLNDGTLVKVLPNEGCWGCPSGNFSLTERLKKVESVITNVKLVHKEVSRDEETFSLFLYTGGKKNKKGKKVTLFEVSGSGGNGYYGTGFELKVVKL